MSDAHDIKKEVRRYLAVFIGLLFLTIVTVAISYLDLPLMEAIILALIVATIKASLVACYFMHLISERKLIYTVLTLTIFFFIGLLILPFLEGKSVPEGTHSLEHKYAKEAPAHGHSNTHAATEKGEAH